jgi:hypothetical protein
VRNEFDALERGDLRWRKSTPRWYRTLESLVDPVTRGDPESPLRWTCKSKDKLAAELRAMGHKVSATKVGLLLHELDYSLQVVRKTREGRQSPDRNAQFEHINRTAKAFMKRGQPVVSVDTKKKELVGDFKNAGREWQPEGLEPEPVRVHDFIDRRPGQGHPLRRLRHRTRTRPGSAWGSTTTPRSSRSRPSNAGGVRWARRPTPMRPSCSSPPTAAGATHPAHDCGASQLQRFADATGLGVSVCHFPPGTSKWNKIEHRLFSHITQNWRGRPLVTRETVVALIRGTTTTTGLRVRAKLDTRRYPTGKDVPEDALRRVQIKPHQFHGEWNYSVRPAETDR